MKVFIPYFKSRSKIKIKIYANLDLNSNCKKYNYSNHKYDRNNGPCYLHYKNDELTYEAYYKNNELHKVDGPAIINHVKNEFEYWINGKEYKNELEYWITVGNYRKEKENK